MKFFIISALTLVSSVAMADGFRCQGNDFRVQMYNEVQPERGTRNAAVLVVYERGVGTIAVLQAAEIAKTNLDQTVVYEGQTNSRQDGRFVYVRLEVAKQAETTGAYADLHAARLTVNADGRGRDGMLSCQRYVKHGE